jgi:PleD family two-component response regulator
MLLAADRALYEAKAAGRDRVVRAEHGRESRAA